MYVIVTTDKKLVKMAKNNGDSVFSDEKYIPVVGVKKGKNNKDERFINHLLSSLAVTPNIKGYHYLKFIMEKCLEHPNYYGRSMTKEIYPECAEAFGTTTCRVERAIRHAISVSYKNAHDMHNKIIGKEVLETPTNSFFISHLAIYMEECLAE